MKNNCGKGQYDDYLTTEERAKVKKDGRRKVDGKIKKPTKLRGQCPHCGMAGK